MKKGMNHYLTGIMICVLVIAIIMILYASSKKGLSDLSSVIEKIRVLLGH